MPEQIKLDFEKQSDPVKIKSYRARRRGEMLGHCICPRTGKEFWLRGFDINMRWVETHSRDICPCCGKDN